MRKLTKETLDEDRLKREIDEVTYRRGKSLFAAGHAKVHKVTDTTAYCSIHDRRDFKVEIKVKNNFLYLKCECLHATRGLICEHDLAACLAVRAHLVREEPPLWRTQLERMVSTVRNTTRSEIPKPYLLFFSLQQDYQTQNWIVTPYQLALSALPKAYHNEELPADSEKFHDLVEEEQLTHRLKASYRALDPAGCVNCNRENVTLANLILDRSRAYSAYYANPPLEDYLSLLAAAKSPLFLGDSKNPLKEELEISSELGQLGLRLELEEDGLRITPELLLGEDPMDNPGDSFRILNTTPLWVLIGKQIFELKDPAWIDLLASFEGAPELLVPQNGVDEFRERYYLRLARQTPLSGNVVAWVDIDVAPTPRVYLSDSQGELQAELRFAYGESEVSYRSEQVNESILREPDNWTLLKIIRKPEIEEEIYQSLAKTTYGLKRSPASIKASVFVLRARMHPVDFLLQKVPKLAQDGFEVYGEEQLRIARVNRNTPSISFNVSSGIDWFDVKTVINFGELEVSLKDIRKAMRKKERYIKLIDGSIGEIPEEWFERYKHLFALAETNDDRLRLSAHHLPIIERSIASADRAITDAAFADHQDRLRYIRDTNFKGIEPVELPENFTGELRPYQKAGYDWLHFLRDFRFGGCLADDMGLGKTIQTLAYLLSLYHRINHDHPSEASLLVVPRSLLINWQREAARFTPELRMMEYFSSSRKKDVKRFSKTDVVITTYGVMLRDIEFLHSYTFNYAILDESQAIKNPLSQTAKAARLIQARHKLVLTGTPIENSTSELWSQFSFLNPGLLGSLDYFRAEIGGPIERDGDPDAVETLRQLVYPFILRRTKDQVAPELPPRSERILYTDMEPAQRKLYNRTRDYYRGLLLGMLEDEGINASRMKILEGLLRLRQISNHPRLIEEKFRGDSGKFELLFETLDTLYSEGHKALVFSQFVQMLTLVRKELDQRNITYAYLDGSTNNRQEVVDRFQTDDSIPFFLISLKAGGLGLNLTAADYVIHIDPWWNPAVEMQASDRTHRIGQDKPVFVYKLITRDSVEEKIVKLQERKKELVDQIITTEVSFFKSLTEEDIQVLFD